MKILILIITLIISVMFFSSSYAKWTKVTEASNGDKYYVDFEKIKKYNGYIHWWQLTNRFKPSPSGVLSGKFYFKTDCKMFRYKTLSFSAYKEPMGKGEGKADNTPDKDWGYLPPNSSMETTLKAVCMHVK